MKNYVKNKFKESDSAKTMRLHAAMSEYDKARGWRQRNELTVIQLSEALGYSQESIYLMERGAIPKGRNKPIQPWTWLRYKRACGDLDAELNGRQKGRVFEW